MPPKTTHHLPQTNTFDEGEQAALVILDRIEVVLKYTDKGLRLRFGPRGRLSPPEDCLGAAVMALIEEGPHSKTFPVLLELFVAAALSLTDDPEADVFALIDETLDLAAFKRSKEADPPTQPKAGVVLAFPSTRKRSNDL